MSNNTKAVTELVDLWDWALVWCHEAGFTRNRNRGNKPGILALHWGDLLQAEVGRQSTTPFDPCYKDAYDVHVWVKSPMFIVGSTIPQEAPPIDFEVQGLSTDGLKVFLVQLQNRVLDRR